MKYLILLGFLTLAACEKDSFEDPSPCAAAAREQWNLVDEDDAGTCKFRIILIEYDGVSYLKEGSLFCERGDAYYTCDGAPVCNLSQVDPDCLPLLRAIVEGHREVRIIGYLP